VPSHGTQLFATTYAIDFIALHHGIPSAVWDWRTLFATEPNERFYAFGQPILAPTDATAAAAHDGEPDHMARRSRVAPMPYALTQPSRIRRGAGAIAGNHVILQITGGGEYVVLAHLRCGSSSDAAGTARPGRPAACYLWQLWQLHPATSAHPGHGLGRPVHR
jgi:hypothetical protein